MNDSVKVFASQSESCIVYIQIGFQIWRPFSNFRTKAEESSRFVSVGCCCLYGIKKIRTHRAHYRDMSHCSKKF